jgi:hypothetical protein
MKNTIKSILAVLIVAILFLLCCNHARAVSPYSTWGTSQLTALGSSTTTTQPGPVLATNSTLYYTNTPATNYVTNADGSIYTNLAGPYFIDATKEQYVALEFDVSSGVANGTAGTSNAIFYLAPAVKNNTNWAVLTYAASNTVPTNFATTNCVSGLAFDTNHLLTITVPLSAAAGVPNVFVTNLNGQGIAGWWFIGASNQVKNGLVTNNITVGYKSDAP